jgi:Tfp pilus assembly protein PilN
MIEINLLPEELKIKTKSKAPEQSGVKIPLALIQEQVFIYAIPVLLVLFILVHLSFAVLLVSKNNQLVTLNRKWLDMAAQKKVLDEFNQELSANSPNAVVLQQLNRQRVLWAQKLNVLSLQLPSGIWFNEIVLNSGNLTIRGSVVSLKNEEIILINSLLNNFKTVPEFTKDFSSFELSDVRKRSLGSYEIADFVLVGASKVK